MRRYPLIAAMLLASVAAAQAGELRSLSTRDDVMASDGSSTPTAPVATTITRADNVISDAAPAADAPRYAAAPAPVQNTAPAASVAPAPTVAVASAPATTNTTATNTTTTKTSATNTATQTSSSSDRHPAAQSTSGSDHVHQSTLQHYRNDRPTAGHILSELHRHGVYW